MTVRSFSLTDPETVKPKRRNDGRDYAAEAIDRLLDAKLANEDFDDALRDLAAVSKRLTDGDVWLAERGPSNPQHEKALRTHAGLSRKQGVLLQTVKLRYTTLYLRVCALHGTLNMLDDDALPAWLAKHAGGAFENDVRSIWRSMQPTRAIPYQGVYPESAEAHHLTGGFTTPEKLENWFTRGASQ